MRIILAGHIIINILGGSTYFLLNSFLGAGVSFVGIAQSIIMYFYNRKEKRPPLWLLAIFVALIRVDKIYSAKKP